MEKKIGDYVKTGDTIAILYTNKKNIKDVALNQFGKAVGISNKKVKPLKEVLAVVK